MLTCSSNAFKPNTFQGAQKFRDEINFEKKKKKEKNNDSIEGKCVYWVHRRLKHNTHTYCYAHKHDK